MQATRGPGIAKSTLCCNHEAELIFSEAKLRSVQEELQCLRHENQLMLSALAAKNTSLKDLVKEKSQILDQITHSYAQMQAQMTAAHTKL